MQSTKVPALRALRKPCKGPPERMQSLQAPASFLQDNKTPLRCRRETSTPYIQRLKKSLSEKRCRKGSLARRSPAQTTSQPVCKNNKGIELRRCSIQEFPHTHCC